jgi:hypothetical protein
MEATPDRPKFETESARLAVTSAAPRLQASGRVPNGAKITPALRPPSCGVLLPAVRRPGSFTPASPASSDDQHVRQCRQRGPRRMRHQSQHVEPLSGSSFRSCSRVEGVGTVRQPFAYFRLDYLNRSKYLLLCEPCKRATTPAADLGRVIVLRKLPVSVR